MQQVLQHGCGKTGVEEAVGKVSQVLTSLQQIACTCAQCQGGMKAFQFDSFQFGHFLALHDTAAHAE